MLQPGTPAPDFTAQDHHGTAVKLASFRGKQVVLWFYPKADTPGCTAEGCGFRDSAATYAAKGIEVLGVSFDTVADNHAFAEKFHFPFRLLCDPDRKLGILYQACDDAKAKYAKRLTYLIGADGRIERAIETKDAAGQAAEILQKLG